ncbi:hypothetical protein STEG23_007560, partial [Scotinomys teguina]
LAMKRKLVKLKGNWSKIHRNLLNEVSSTSSSLNRVLFLVAEIEAPPSRERFVNQINVLIIIINNILRDIPSTRSCCTCLTAESVAEMGRRQCKSTYNNMKNKTSPESSPPPTPRPEHCNVDKAEENDFKNSLMKMIEEALEGKMKNAIKEIEEKNKQKIGGNE